MRKQILIIILLFILSLTGCKIQADDFTIRVGALAAPNAEILEMTKQELEKKGYHLEIVEYTDYQSADSALENGEINANYVQNISELDSYNRENGTHLVSLGKIHYEPMAIYTAYQHRLDSLKNGSNFLIPEDQPNQTRALKLLEDNGLIKLKDVDNPVVSDIIENKKGIVFNEMKVSEIARNLAYTDLAVIPGNEAISSQLKIKGEYVVSAEKTKTAKYYSDILAVKEENATADWAKTLYSALREKEVKNYINKTYEGNANFFS